MIRHILTFLAVGMTVLALSLSSPAAQAGDPVIDAAKERGTVGEQIAGYLAIVDGADADPATRRKVNEINALRRQAYEGVVASTGESLDAVARVTGEKLVREAETGTFVFDDSDRWVRKP